MSTSTDRLRRLFDEAIANKITPAIAASFGTSESSYSFYAGTHDFSLSIPCNQNTIFDLASLTKILSTTLVTAEAVSHQKLSLFENPFSWWPNVKVIDLLQHTSGLPAWKNYYSVAKSSSDIVSLLFQTPTDSLVTPKTVYSDLGFIALGYLLEMRLREKLDVVFRHLTKCHIPKSKLSFRSPDAENNYEAISCAPTGFCSFRRRELRGEVNDLNAFAMKGVAAHAGLFGSLNDVVLFAKFIMSATRHRTDPISNVLYQFSHARGERAIGFDKATKSGSTAGVFSPLAFGHLGFTGTSLWIDPTAAHGRGAYFILLTNHLQASSSKRSLLHLRRAFHRLAYQTLTADF